MHDEIFPHGRPSFEARRLVNDHGAEYWSARELQGLLGYSEWRDFSDAIKRARTSCETSGNKPQYHFGAVNKMIELAKCGQREVNAGRRPLFRRQPGRHQPVQRRLHILDQILGILDARRKPQHAFGDPQPGACLG